MSFTVMVKQHNDNFNIFPSLSILNSSNGHSYISKCSTVSAHILQEINAEYFTNATSGSCNLSLRTTYKKFLRQIFFVMQLQNWLCTSSSLHLGNIARIFFFFLRIKLLMSVAYWVNLKFCSYLTEIHVCYITSSSQTGFSARIKNSLNDMKNYQFLITMRIWRNFPRYKCVFFCLS